MVNQQPEKSREDRELEPEHDTVDLTTDELRSLSGGSSIHLNLEIEKRPKTHGHSHERTPHGKR
jgi:hypothetical protein